MLQIHNWGNSSSSGGGRHRKRPIQTQYIDHTYNLMLYKYVRHDKIRIWCCIICREGESTAVSAATLTVSIKARDIKDHLVPPTGRTDSLSDAQWQPDHLIGHNAVDYSDCSSQILVQVYCQLAARGPDWRRFDQSWREGVTGACF